LAVARGFGDLEYKQAAKVVTAVPDVFIRNVDLDLDSFVVIGSDGIWGPVPDEEAVRIVGTALRDGGDDPLKAAAQQICEVAHSREPHDDKTCTVIWFGSLPDADSAVDAGRAHANLAAARMKPRHVAATDGMFTTQAAAAPQAPPAPKDDDDLDNLFSAYARDMS